MFNKPYVFPITDGEMYEFLTTVDQSAPEDIEGRLHELPSKFLNESYRQSNAKADRHRRSASLYEEHKTPNMSIAAINAIIDRDEEIIDLKHQEEVAEARVNALKLMNQNLNNIYKSVNGENFVQ